MVYRPWSLEGQRLEQRSLKEPIPTMDVGLTWARGRQLGDAARVFRTFLTQTLGRGD
jgi:DNA-binding transcriptional LysR family regulator